MSTRRCAGCGALSTANAKLRRCTRCLGVHYCSRDCQRADWKSHKKTCGKSSSGLPPGVSRSLPSPLAMKAMVKGGYRMITVAEPANVLGCCWCCAVLLKACGPRGTNPANDLDGPFYTATHGRTDGGVSGRAVPGRTFPALHVLGTPGSTGFRCAVNNHGQAAACLSCIHGLKSDAAAHLHKCEEWLRDERLATSGLPDLTIAEKRAMSVITLDQAPDLSLGRESIAGRFSKDKGKTLSVPFTFKDLETHAFPHLLVCASGFKGKDSKDLIAYTMMRLYSADKRWRKDPDYVVFSLHRLAAYGMESAASMAEQLPEPMPAERADEIEQIEISFKPDFV